MPVRSQSIFRRLIWSGLVISLLLPIWLLGAVSPVQAQTPAPGQDPPADLLAGVRYRAFTPSAEEEIYLGVPDLDSGANRVAQQYDWQPSQSFTLQYDGALELVVQIGANEPLIYGLDVPLGPANYLEIQVKVAELAAVAPGLTNVTLNGAPLGDFPGTAGSTSFWHVGDYDFGAAWTLAGEIEVVTTPPLGRTGPERALDDATQIEILVGGISRIVVEKATNPVGAAERFAFSGSLSGSIGAGEQLRARVTGGVYTVTETNIPAGFVLDAITCDDANSSGDLTGAEAVYRVEPGETVTCLFTNETPGVIIEESGGESSVTEGATAQPGRAAGYTVKLRSKPETDVTISVLPDAQVRVNRTVLLFTPDSWNRPQEVLIRAIDDDLDEDQIHPGAVDHAVSSGDPKYNDVPAGYQTPFTNPSRVDPDPRTVDAQVTDNDLAAVVITDSSDGSPLVEGTNQQRFYTVRLNSQPRAAVTLSLATDGQVERQPATLAFDAGDWETPKIVTVTTVDDDIVEGLHSGDITHSAASSDGQYNGSAANFIASSPVTAPQSRVLRFPIEDDDIPGIVFVPDRVNVLEGGVGQYRVALQARPTQNVTVAIATDSQVDTDVATLLFTPANWMTEQPVRVTAVDDNDAEGPHLSNIVHTAISTDPNYQALAPATVVADIADNDSPSVFVSPSVLQLDEGGSSKTYQIVLTTEPAADVVIEFAYDAQVTLNRNTLLFTPETWSEPQVVIVTAVDDSIDESTDPAFHLSYISHGVASDDLAYNSIPANGITMSIRDNDEAAVLVAAQGINATEDGQTAVYAIRLATRPTALLTLLAQYDEDQIRLDKPVLRFDANNWSEPQQVTVTAIDDAVDEGPHTVSVVHDARSTDGRYNAAPVSPIDVIIEDNDAAGMDVSRTRLLVSENGRTDSYAISLRSAPTALVTVQITGDAQAQADALTLFFDPENWETPQTVTVRAVNDGANETGPGETHPGVITHRVTSDDPNYEGFSLPAIAVDILDNDWPSTVWLPIVEGE
jgi:hypothetical protein